MKYTVTRILDGMIYLSVIALVIVLSSACAPFSNWQGGKDNLERLRKGEWTLKSLIFNGSEVTIPLDKITLSINAENQASGLGGCNRYSGAVQTDRSGNLTFGALISTKMACRDTMQAETAYFNALAKINRYVFESDNLVLTSSDSQTKLVFSK
jgi:heat shock protein HslJ